MNFFTSAKSRLCSSLALAGRFIGKFSRKLMDWVFSQSLDFRIPPGFVHWPDLVLNWWPVARDPPSIISKSPESIRWLYNIKNHITSSCIPEAISCFQTLTTYAHWSPYVKPLSVVILFNFSWQRGFQKWAKFISALLEQAQLQQEPPLSFFILTIRL